VLKFATFRVRAKITSQNWRSDLVQIWLIRESKTTGIASYFEANFIRSGASEVSAKDGLKLRCKNVKLFLREPLGGPWFYDRFERFTNQASGFAGGR